MKRHQNREVEMTRFKLPRGGKTNLRVCFLGLYKESNLGDEVITCCTEELYAQYLGPKVECTRLYLDKAEKLMHFNWILKRINSLFWHLTSRDLYEQIYKYEAIALSTIYFARNLKRFDLVVVNGGGLIKFTHQFFGYSIQALLNCCSRKNIPVVINAVGVEEYDSVNVKCQYLKQALRSPSLYYISTRDNLDTLINNYFDGQPIIPCRQVCDPAVWASEIYKIKSKPNTNVVGLGIAWFDIFSAHYYRLSDNEAEQLYVNIVEMMIQNGHEVELFTNGAENDNAAAKHVQNRLKERNIEVAFRAPVNDTNLIEIISQYKAIVATRLHSCIIAYSLNIPAIGLVWNPKLSLWGENIKCKDWYFSKDYKASEIIKALETALFRKYDSTVRNKYRNTIVDSINEISYSMGLELAYK